MGELERLGATHEYGSFLLRLLELDGWTVHRTTAFAGDGMLVVARKGAFEVRGSGATLAEFATDMFMEAMALKGVTSARRPNPDQLQLVDAAAGRIADGR